MTCDRVVCARCGATRHIDCPYDSLLQAHGLNPETLAFSGCSGWLAAAAEHERQQGEKAAKEAGP